MIYLLIYVLILLFTIVERGGYDKRAASLYFALLLSTFVGMRGNIDPDYLSYLDIYNGNFENIEIGFALLCKIANFLGFQFNFFLFIICLISLSIKFLYFSKHSPFLFLSILIYYSTTFFIFDFIMIRQGLAISLLIYSLHFYKKSHVKFVLIVILASTIHISSLAFLMILLLNRKLYVKVQIIFLFMMVITVINVFQIRFLDFSFIFEMLKFPDFLMGKVNYYQSNTDPSFLSMKQLFWGWIFCFYFLNTKSEQVKLYIYIYIIGLLLGTVLISIPEFSFRLKWNFLWVECLILPFLLKAVAEKFRVLKYASLPLFAYVYAIGLVNFLESVSASGFGYIYPYKTFLVR